MIDKIIAKELLAARATYICNVCAMYALEEGPPSKRSKFEDETGYSLEQLIHKIEKDELPQDVLVKVGDALGKSQYT